MTMELASFSSISEYERIPIAFEVRRLMHVDDRSGRLELRAWDVAVPYTKNYDDVPGERPSDWARRFDVSNWQLLVAREGPALIGGAAIAMRTPDIVMLEGRDDLAVLWDIRVQPAWRRRGVGTALFDASVEHARSHGCRQLKVETQDTNHDACVFYARMGCQLAAANRSVYASHPDEIQLLWYKDL